MLFKFALNLKQALIVFEKIIAASSLLLLLLITITQIIARNFFDTGFSEVEILSRHLVLFITFMGAALVSEQNKHIKIDILSAFMNNKQNKALVRPLQILSSIICGLLAWYAIAFWIDEWNYTTDYEKFSVYLALILPTGFIILSLHLLLLTITGIKHDKT